MLEYSDNCFIKLGSCSSYYVDEVKDDTNENNDTGYYRINSSKKTTSKSFEYKTILIENTPADNIAEVVTLLNYSNNFWRFLNFPFINFEIDLDLSGSKNCEISEILRTPEVVVSIQWKQC